MANNWNSYNDDDILAQYFAGQSDLQPEEIALRRKQAQVDALRDRGLQEQEGKMVGNTFVAPSIAQYAAQLGNAYMGRKGQEGVDKRVSAQDVLRQGLRYNLTGAFDERYNRKKTPEEKMAEQAERMRQPINS